MNRRECKLLPHISQPLYGLSPHDIQFLPWAIKRFNVQDAWKHSRGENVTVAVIDTGCDLNHVDIKDNLLPGRNFVDNNHNPQDVQGHGTHVAGTIAAIDNSYGMVGVAPATKIIPIKSLGDNGSGSMRDVANGVMWAVDHGAEIITMSLGSPYPSRALQNALRYARDNKVIVFCAAGNDGNGIDINYPAKFLETIAIGSINHSLGVSDFSCCGDTLDFVSPGEDVISAAPGNKYARLTGTSMATPYAVGCAALLLSLSKKQRKIYKLEHKDDYIREFSENAIPLTGRHSGDRRYEGNGIIVPKLSLTPSA
tara:strand:+ start:48 stop:980 length:933 start_codon:yes stop_codon:yes gene_type:complete